MGWGCWLELPKRAARPNFLDTIVIRALSQLHHRLSSRHLEWRSSKSVHGTGRAAERLPLTDSVSASDGVILLPEIGLE